MLRAGAGLSSDPSTERAGVKAATEAMTRAGIDRADIVFLFFTADHIAESERLLAAACRVTGTDRIVGCSGAGVLTGEGEVEGGPGLAVLVVSSDCVRGHPFLFHPLRDRDRELGIDLARGAGKRLEENSLLVLFPDAYNGQPQIVFQGIEDQFGFLPAVGAGSSENGTQGKTYQLCGQAMTSNAVSGVCLTGPFHSSIGITQGCRPVTEPMIITKAQGNLIFEIDNRPAFEFFARAIKGPLLEDLRRALTCVFAGLPSDPDNNRVAPGEYLVRNIVGLDPEKGILAVAEKVFQGERIVLTLRDAQRAREDLNQMLQRQSISLGDRAPQFGLYFNCCARGTSLYGISGIDTAYIRQALGDFPLVGFFGNFELGPLGGKNRLLAYTGVLVLVTER